jgi:hypothetical protein
VFVPGKLFKPNRTKSFIKLGPGINVIELFIVSDEEAKEGSVFP